jgi:hypothetical protein
MLTLPCANRFAVALIGTCALLSASAGSVGCLSDDTSAAPQPPVDAGLGFDAGQPTIDDAGGGVDGAADALPPDSGPRTGDAGHGAGVTQAGLVAAGTMSRSSNYTMTGTVGPATAPVLRSPHYQFVGGVSVTSQQPQ